MLRSFAKVKHIFIICTIFFALANSYDSVAQCVGSSSNWYCDDRLNLNLRAGIVEKITPFEANDKTKPITNFIYDGTEYKTTDVIRLRVVNIESGEETADYFEFFNVASKNDSARTFKVGEKYLFEINEFGVNNRGKNTFEYKLAFIRPNGFVKLYADATEEIELHKKAKNFDKFAELLGVAKEEAIFSGVVSGKAVNLPKPNLSKENLKIDKPETVSVLVLIGEDGTVLKAKAFCFSQQILATAAEQAAQAAKFSPIKVDNKPVKVKGFINYIFVP